MLRASFLYTVQANDDVHDDGDHDGSHLHHMALASCHPHTRPHTHPAGVGYACQLSCDLQEETLAVEQSSAASLMHGHVQQTIACKCDLVMTA